MKKVVTNIAVAAAAALLLGALLYFRDTGLYRSFDWHVLII